MRVWVVVRWPVCLLVNHMFILFTVGIACQLWPWPLSAITSNTYTLATELGPRWRKWSDRSDRLSNCAWALSRTTARTRARRLFPWQFLSDDATGNRDDETWRPDDATWLFLLPADKDGGHFLLVFDCKEVVLSFATNFVNHIYCFHVYRWNYVPVLVKNVLKLALLPDGLDMNCLVNHMYFHIDF